MFFCNNNLFLECFAVMLSIIHTNTITINTTKIIFFANKYMIYTRLTPMARDRSHANNTLLIMLILALIASKGDT